MVSLYRSSPHRAARISDFKGLVSATTSYWTSTNTWTSSRIYLIGIWITWCRIQLSAYSSVHEWMAREKKSVQKDHQRLDLCYGHQTHLVWDSILVPFHRFFECLCKGEGRTIEWLWVFLEVRIKVNGHKMGILNTFTETRNLRGRYVWQILWNGGSHLCFCEVYKRSLQRIKSWQLGSPSSDHPWSTQVHQPKYQTIPSVMKHSVASLVVAAFALAGLASASPVASPSNTTVLESLEVSRRVFAFISRSIESILCRNVHQVAFSSALI